MSRIARGTVTALIPARGGSKGVPRKNVREVAGKPLIAWTIQSALASDSLDRVIVSTDDEEIAEISMKWGAEVPFYRPAELSQDNSPSIDAVIHAIRWMEDESSYCPDAIMLLQPTSPLRRSEDIRNAVNLFFERNVSAVVSVQETHQHPFLLKTMDENGFLSNFITGSSEHVRRQELPPVYALNGAIYLIRREILLRNKTFHPEGTLGYTMPPQYSLDIDSPTDLLIANLLLAHGRC